MMQKQRQRQEQSTVFGFDRQLTLASYVPKKGKAVILLSSMHQDATTDASQNSKPEIILHYNDTKSGVDNLDHLSRLYTCKRKIKRWPMTIFFNVVDCAAVAAYVVWTAAYPDWNANKRYRRRLFLNELGFAMVDEELQRRSQNPRAMQRQVKHLSRLAELTLACPILCKLLQSSLHHADSIASYARVAVTRRSQPPVSNAIWHAA